MFRVAIVLAVCGALVAAMSTTHRPRPTHEPSEHSTFTFIYEQFTHKFLIITGHDCYIFPLTTDERIAVHSDAGIKALELKLAGQIDSGTKTAVQKEDLNNHVAHACSRKINNYYMMS